MAKRRMAGAILLGLAFIGTMVSPIAAAAPASQEVIATLSIVAVDPSTGDLGVAVTSKFPAVGNGVPWAKAGVGAVATQAAANLSFGEEGLALMAGGMTANAALAKVLAADEQREERQ